MKVTGYKVHAGGKRLLRYVVYSVSNFISFNGKGEQVVIL